MTGCDAQLCVLTGNLSFVWYNNQFHSLWITAHYQGSTVQRCRIMTYGGQNICLNSLFMILLCTAHTLSTVHLLATCTTHMIVASLSAMLVSVLTQTMLAEGQCLAVRITMSDDGMDLAAL